VNHRILVVDDEEMIRALLSVALSKAGFSVQTAADVAEAMERCSAEQFAMVVSDVRMPGLSGHDLVRWLAVAHPATRTVMMSGCDLECSGCPHTGRCSYLHKPFLPGDAVALVKRLLAGGSNGLARTG
jgi:DNA-binding NtrC family response regulator